MVRPYIPNVSEAAPEDDPTGVRAMLSALPEPDPMPEHLVERINASLAAEQTHRADRTSGAAVTPIRTRSRRRPGRLLFAVASAAAAVAVVATIGSNILTANESATSSAGTALDSTSRTDSSSPESSSARGASRGAPYSSDSKADDRAAAGLAATPSLVQIRLSDTRYTRTAFVTQARLLRGATFAAPQPTAGEAPAIGPVGTTPGLTECLTAIGAAGAQRVLADVALYEGQPAVIIVATTDGIPMAFAVGRQCSTAGAMVLQTVNPLP